MRGDCRREVFGRSQIFLPPEIADSLCPRQLEFGNLERDRRRLLAAIEDPNGPAPVVQRLGPNFCIAVLSHAGRFPAEDVLIDGQHFIVRKHTEREVVELRQIAAD